MSAFFRLSDRSFSHAKHGAVGCFLGSIVVIALMFGCVTGCGKPKPPTKSDPVDEPTSTDSDDVRDDAIARLIKNDWTPQAAKAVVDHSHRYLQLVHDEDPNQFRDTLAVLARLGAHPFAQQKLVQMPELAGLLAGSLEQHPEGPTRVLKTIPDGIDRDIVLSLYCLSAMPSDCIALADTLKNDGDIIVRLCKRDVIDGMAWFVSLPKNQAAETYRKWARSVLDLALKSTDDEALDRAQTLLTIHAPAVRDLLETNPDFERRFLHDYWPSFNRIVLQQADDVGWGIFVSDARVWKFFFEFDEPGKKLFATHGPLAIDLLMADDYRDCQKQVLAALAQGDELTIQSLYDPQLRTQPLFVKLLKRDLPGGTMAKALHTLGARPADVPSLLNYWDELSDAALIEDVGPPPDGPQTWLPGYNLYYLGKKYAQGRNVTGMDVVFAAVDTAEVVFMVKGAGKGLKAIQVGLKDGLVKRGLRETAESVSKRSSRELFPWVLREGRRSCRLGLQSIRGRAMIDVTGAIQFAFEKSGMGRKTFKELSGVEARVFMRADRRVLLDLGTLVESNHVVGRALRESAINAGCDLSLKTEPGEAAAESVVKSGVAVGQQVEAWRRHIAIWWLAANDGSLKRPASVSSQR